MSAKITGFDLRAASETLHGLSITGQDKHEIELAQSVIRAMTARLRQGIHMAIYRADMVSV